MTAYHPYTLHLDIPIKYPPTVIDTSRQRHPDLTDRKMWTLKPDLISQDLIEFLDDHGIGLRRVEMMYSPPRWRGNIHIDANDPIHLSNRTKLNFVFGGVGSCMEWYESTTIHIQTTPGMTKMGTPFIRPDPGKMIMSWAGQISDPSIMNVGKPHLIDNQSDIERWCISHILTDLATNEVLQWNDACRYLASYLRLQPSNGRRG